MIEKIYNKFMKVGKWMDKGLIHRTVDNINKNPECTWIFVTTVLLVGGFGVGLCLVWFYLLLKQGMPVWAIIFDSAVIVFCGWAVVKGIIPACKEVYKNIEKRIKEQDNTQ